jgi:polysaccharide biosynthesis protein PslG
VDRIKASVTLLLAGLLGLTQPLPGAEKQGTAAVKGSEKYDPSPFGFSCDNQTTYTLATYCPQMAKAGIRWIRGFPTFNVIEPTQGKFDWSSVDTMIATAAKNNMSISGLFFYNAPWINAKGDSLPIENLPAWSDYVSRVVEHSKQSVKYWEVWNETPNFIGKGTAADYARTVVAAFDAAKAADPTCQVGLSIQSQNVTWIEQTIQAGAKDHFDFIAVHPYETLGVVESDGCEAEFMSIVPTIRKMLAKQNPARENVPIWFTEIGREAGKDEKSQASALVKAFAMGMAQGVARINWFEGKDGDSGPMGLLRGDGTPRPAFNAMSNLTRHLGPNPRYIGWVLLKDAHYGFIFEGASAKVMATWARPGTARVVTFGSRVRMVDPLSGVETAAEDGSLSSVPMLIVGVPPALVARAEANRSRPFPWGGDYTGAKSVSVRMGSPNTEQGLHHLASDATSRAVKIRGELVRDCSNGASQTFTVDPNFLSYAAQTITITAVVRRQAAKENAGFNLKYESTAGWKGAESWYTIPDDLSWHTKTWTITDPQFVGKWGFNFALDSDGARFSKYQIRSVTVAKVAAPQRAPLNH